MIYSNKKTIILFIIFSIFISCEGPEGPTGPQGETGPIYPEHMLTSISGVVWESDTQPNTKGINFDTKNWWNINDIGADSLYDIIITIDYNDDNKIKINTGNNAYTEIYLLESVSSFTEIDTFPDASQKRNQVIFESSDPTLFLMVKNRYERWAKVRISQQIWNYWYYNWATEAHYYYWFLLESYYYKDLTPDFTLHKTGIGG